MTQAEALSILTTGASVFLTGRPGSGKTHTVNSYIAWLRARGIEPAITASTGIAATHLHGQTIHSWSGIGIADGLTPELLEKVAGKEHVVKRLRKTHILIIDEISMLSGNVLDMVDAVLKEVRQDPRPFGGMQIVFVGDFFQLPPVRRPGSIAPFAFESRAWREANPLICYLEEQHRQEDEKLLALLDAIRDESWDESHAAHLMRRESEEELGDVPRLYTHNEDVDRINDEMLTKLKSPAQKSYQMQTKGSAVLIEGLKRGCLSPERLMLKTGALVMCTKNNPALGFANGTLGRIAGFEHSTGNPLVEVSDGRVLSIAPMEWAVEEDGKVRASVTQVPLRLAWAITIHKSQGMSMDEAAMDLSRVFEPGQGYVALSRVRSLSGLHLLGWSDAALRIHPQVRAIDQQFRLASEEAARAFEALKEQGEYDAMVARFVLALGGAEGKQKQRSTYEETLHLLREGHDVDDIAKARGLTKGTVCDHLEKLSREEKISGVEVRQAIPKRLASALPAIHEMFEKVGATKLAPAHTKLKGKYSYDDLRIARLAFDR